jgi:hypothetical protein
MSATNEAQKLLRTLTELLTATDDNIPAKHLQFLLRVYLAGDAGTSHEKLQTQGFSASVASRLMQDFTKVRSDKRTPGFDLIDVTLDPTNFRRKIIRINQRGEKVLNRILTR